MTKIQRVWNFISGLLMLVCGVVMIRHPYGGFQVVTVILGFSLLIYGIRQLAYYFTMARQMVGGEYILYIGLIVFDFGVFTLALADIPRVYLVLYLLGCHAFAGCIDILRGLEAKRLEAPWKLTVSHGVVNVMIAAACCIFLGSIRILVYLYSIGLIYSAAGRIIKTFRRTAIVYIQ